MESATRDRKGYRSSRNGFENASQNYLLTNAPQATRLSHDYDRVMVHHRFFHPRSHFSPGSRSPSRQRSGRTNSPRQRPRLFSRAMISKGAMEEWPGNAQPF